MSITASRLGSSPITLDWSNLVAVPGAGRPGPVDAFALQEAWGKLRGRFSTGEIGFYDTPVNAELSRLEPTRQLAQSILERGTVTDCLFLGIGGSSLGPLSLLSALEDKKSSGIRFHFLENPDPYDWKGTLAKLRPESTLVCAVTKSGTTFETMAQLLLALEWLGPTRLKTNLVAITDPAKGDLRAFAQHHGIQTLPIAPSIGGRFSVFTPVGLFAAALAGLSLDEFLKGAKQVRDYVEKTAVEKNPLFILAYELLRHGPKRPIHVMMPYSTRLKTVASWFVQLWGESLGKDGKGFTPLAALGAVDQHSILQLLRDGPDDKVTFFIGIDEVTDPVKIKPQRALTMQLDAFRILENHTLQDLLRYEMQAIATVLTKRNRPNFVWQLDRLDERAMGALFFALATLTSITGTLMGVNPFDQPGVEEGKVYIRQSLTEHAAHAQIAEEDENSPVNRLRRHRETPPQTD
jgi:glucose-6-phosphate isomerase